MNVALNKFLNVQAYKYNGKLYRQWSGVRILEDNEDHVVVYLDRKTKVMEKSKHRWTIRDNTIWFFHKKHFFNALITIKNNRHYIYINLASPYFAEENTIKYIDYDLDIKVYPNKDLNIIDRAEFINNAKKMKYSRKLIDVVFEELKKLVNWYYDDYYIFNGKYIDNFLNKFKIK
ncbi:DUF402 domain-containing protein [Mesomycoplasma lagogenitalium]|uniref:DUF402 domain-containing protein n=1 Tax=Mesomycoplasma lagogenitalium TaxID=171286 RepID=A0ABY8LTQ3_9BACT|nr:DUF402 domain-containing protein [Mesomycoplasma lagogenitalium]WGI36614.1 DUF402 domain-containing protein [Mesomycoplasma lagogenitalium]